VSPRFAANIIDDQNGVAADAGASDALTQRVIPANDSPTYGTEDSAAPTYTEQVGGKHETTPTQIEDGDLGALLLTAYKYLVTAGYSPTQDAMKAIEQSPWGMDYERFNALAAVTANTTSSTFDVTNYHSVGAWIVASAITTGGLIEIEGSYDEGTTFTDLEVWPIVEADAFYVSLPAGLTHVRAVLSNRTDGTYTVTFFAKGAGGQNDGRKRLRYGPWCKVYDHGTNAITNTTWVTGDQKLSVEGAIAIEYEIDYTFDTNGFDFRWAYRNQDDSAYTPDLDSSAASNQITLAATVEGKMPHATPRGRTAAFQTYGNGAPGGTTAFTCYARAVYDTV